jgi:hypothetical protein
MLRAASLLPKPEKLATAPMAQHSQPITLLGRRATMTAPTVRNTMNGRHPIAQSKVSMAGDRVGSGTTKNT